MKAEFTAIYETHPNGTVKASVAELPSILAGGQTREEAQARLAKKLQLFLECMRLQSLARTDLGTHVEGIQVETRPLSQAVSWAGQRCWKQDEAEFWLTLLQEGLIDDISALPEGGDDEDFEPIPIEGKPISQEIIEDRR